MRRLPIRLRLTAVFTLAVVAVIAGAGVFVYLRLASDLDDAIDDSLARRAAAVVAARLDVAAGAAPDSEDGVAQVASRAGRLLAATGGSRRPVLTPAEAGRAARRTLLLERPVPGIDASTRILARPAPGGGVVVVGQSLEDRDETLRSVARSFAIGGSVAVVMVALLGYALATAGMAPIEAMRRRAGEISLAGRDELLPLPEARDEVRRLGRTLNEMLGRLRASFEREQQFAADASHELRTPIAVIKAELEAALRSDELGPGAHEAVVAAAEECDALAALAEDLLIIARVGDGRLPVRGERMDAGELLAGVRDRFADRATERGRTIRVDTPGAPLELHADPLRMRQALGNLVDNALRHGRGDVVLRARDRDRAAELEVADAGDGFDPAISARAFERFARGPSSRGGDGAGLGLAIVRAVAEAHGGSAAIVAGDGATVRLTLPKRARSR